MMTKAKKGLITLLSLFLSMGVMIPQGISVAAEEAEGTEAVQEILEESVPEEVQESAEAAEAEEENDAAEETAEEEAVLNEEPVETAEEEAAQPEESEETEEPAEEPSAEPEQDSEPEAAEQEKTEAYITLSASGAELTVGESFTFEALVNGTEEELTVVWSTDNPAVITVDDAGTVTAVGEGAASVRASVMEGTVYADALVIVKAAEEPVVLFEEDCYEVGLGESVTVPYTLNGEADEVVWTVDHEDVIGLDVREGEVTVTGLAGGTALVTATAGGVSSTFGVVVLVFEEEAYEDAGNLDAAGDKPVNGTYSVRYMQTSARDLATALNYYRWSSAQLSTITYDYTIEKHAMTRAAEIVLSFSDTRPDGQAWSTVFANQYGSNLSEVKVSAWDGSLGNAQQALAKILADNTSRSKSLRKNAKSFGAAHVNYNGIDYWVVLFSDVQAKNTSQSTPVDWNQNVTVKIRGALYSTFSFTSSSSTIKVKVNSNVSLPSINGKVKVTLGGQQTDISVSGYTVSWAIKDDKNKDTSMAYLSGGKIYARGTPTNDPTVLLYAIATVKMNGNNYTVKVPLKIIMPVSGVKLNKTSEKIDLGKTLQLVATVEPYNATDKTVTWSTSSSKIASVSSKGLVTGKKGGKATITVKTNDGGKKATCAIEVIVHPTNIAFEFSELTMTVGMSEKLVPVFTPADTTDKRVTYSIPSASSQYIGISQDGTLTAKKITPADSPATVTVKTVDGGLEADLSVTVKDKDKVRTPSASYYYDEYEFSLWDDEENLMEKGSKIRLKCDTKDAEIFYTLDGSTPTASSTRYSEFIIFEGGNKTLKVMARLHSQQMYDSDVITYNIVECDEPTWEIMEEDLEKLLGDDGKYHIPSGIWTAGIPEQVSFTGAKIEFPDARVYCGHHLLELKKDYTVSYKNNTNVCPEGTKACEITYRDDGSYVPVSGTKVASVMITGKGNYKDKVYVPFKIMPLAISEENGFSYQSEIYLTIGAAEPKKGLKPVPVILRDGKKLKNNTDFVIAYSEDAEGTKILEDGIKKAGEYYVIVSGVKNYTYGTPKFVVPVHVKAEAALLSKASVKVSNVEYTGAPIDPESLTISVKLGGKDLVKGTDYVIASTSPETLQEIGKASVTIKAADGSSYVGEKTAAFSITGKSLSKAKVYCLGSSVEYKGSAFELKDLRVYDPKRPDISEVSVYDDSTKLTEGTDYTVSITGENKGSGTVKFTGIGNYTGTITKKFTIKPKQPAKDDLLIFVGDVYFSKSGAVPYVYVLYNADGIRGDDYQPGEYDEVTYETYLQEGIDYTVKCFNNKKPYTDSEYKTKNPPSVSIIMKGNYKGTFANNHFLILEEDITWMSIEAADTVYAKNKKGPQYYVKPVVYDYEGKKLTLNKDYTLSYTYAQDAKVNGSSVVNRAYGTPVRPNDNPEPNTVIAVTATGTGSYYGTLTAEYKIIEKKVNISSAKVVIDYKNGKNKYFEYTGGQIIPGSENLTVTLKVDGVQKTLKYGEDYEIQSLKNNVKAGKATMVIRGIGEYGGQKNVSFTIGKLSMVIEEILRKLLGL